MNKHKQYKELEKSLILKYNLHKENEIVLNDEDFKDGKLSIFGFYHLKQECEYIPYNQEIEIKIPGKYEKDFKNTLNQLGTNELIKIKKDIKYAKTTALILLLFGVIFIILGNVFDFFKGDILKSIVIIASWVFVWGAVERWFFDQRELMDKRISLLQILSAKIIIM